MSRPTVGALLDHIEHFRARVLQDALAEATSSYWLRRAEDFAAVGTPRCDEIAQACRNAAALALVQDHDMVPVPPRITCPVCGTPTSPWTCSCGQTRVGGAA